MMKKVVMFMVGLATAMCVQAKTLTVELVQNNKVISGVTSDVAFDVFATSDDAMYGFNLFLQAKDAAAIEFKTNTINSEALNAGFTNASGVEADFVSVSLGDDIGKSLMPAASSKVKIATVTADVKLQNGSVEIEVSLDSTAFNAANQTSTPWDSISLVFGTEKVDSTNGEIETVITIPVLESFNFSVAENAVFETEEDVEMTIDAASDNFDCTIWDTTQNALVESTDVEFTAASVVADATVETDPIATVAIVDGKIVVTPVENMFGDVTINFTASATEASGVEASVDGSFTVTITPVDDPATITFAEIAPINEGETLTLAINFDDPDNNSDAYSTRTVVWGDEELEGAWDGDTFTATFDYNTVAHPDTERTADLTVTFAKEDGSAETSATAELTVKDVDQAPTAPANVTVPSSYKFSDGDFIVVIADDASTDPDGDTVTYEITIENIDKSGPAGEFRFTPEEIKKSGLKKSSYIGGVVRAVSTFNGTTLKSEGTSMTRTEISNSTPVAKDGSIFIQKTQDVTGETKVTATFTPVFEDADDNDFKEFSLQGTSDNLEVTMSNGVYTIEIIDPTQEVINGFFKFTVIDSSDQPSEVATVTVNYREDPAPVITAVTAPVASYDEVDAAGNATVIAVEFSAADQVIEGAPETSGVKAFNAILKRGDETLELAAETTLSEGAGTATYKASYTLGYDFLAGADRAASDELTFTITATDGVGAVSDPLTYTITVKDVDRKPTAPTAVTLSPETIVTDTDITAEATGSTDPDGDEVTYSYDFSLLYNGQGIGNGTSDDGRWPSSAVRNPIKGETVSVIATPTSTPKYEGAKALTGDTAKVEVTAGNTAPELSPKYSAMAPFEINEAVKGVNDQEAITLTIDEWTTDYDDSMMSDVAAIDRDMKESRDSLTYTIDDANCKDVADVTVEGKTITIARKLNKVTAEPVSFKLTATDESGEAATADVFFKIDPIDEAPVLVDMPYIYVSELNEDGSAEVTATFKVDFGSDDEDESQTIDATNTTITCDGAELTFVVNDDKTLAITANIPAGSKLGDPDILFNLTLVDTGNGDEPNANTTSGIEGRIILSATPWYPIYNAKCEESEGDGLLVEIKDGDTRVAEIILTSKTDDGKYIAKPVDYFNSGFEGLYCSETEDENKVYTYTEYHWTYTAGKGEACSEATDVNVAYYNLPAVPTVTRNENEYTVSAPLAGRYEATFVDKNSDKVVKTVDARFIPNADGIIVPNATFTLELPAGEYSLEVVGINPKGKGEAFQMDVTIAADGEETLDDWGNTTEGFTPAEGWSTTIAEESAQIVFQWPVSSVATDYVLTIKNGDGKTFEEISTDNVNSVSVSGIDPGNYYWFVTAKSGSQSKTSYALSFTVREATEDPVATGAFATDEGKLSLNFINAKAEAKYTLLYLNDSNQWVQVVRTAAADENGNVVFDDINVTKGSYVMFQLYGTDDAYSLFIVQ